MSDIVEELRSRTTGIVLLSDPPQFQKDGLCQRAADEIERLRAERDELRAELTAAQTVASEHETDAIAVDEERFVAWAERDRAVAERDALREENARLRGEVDDLRATLRNCLTDSKFMRAAAAAIREGGEDGRRY